MTTVRTLQHQRPTRILTWVPVTDASGHARMEMRWQVGTPAPRVRRRVAA